MPIPQTREDGDLLCISLEAACSAAVILFGKGINGPQACLTHPRGTESEKVAQGSLTGMLFSPFNKLMLSRYTGVSAIPIYEIAFTGSMQIRALFEAGLRALMPEKALTPDRGESIIRIQTIRQ